MSLFVLLVFGRPCGVLDLFDEVTGTYLGAQILNCTRIDLQHSSISARGVIDLAQAILVNSSDALMVLQLGGTAAGDPAAVALAQATASKDRLSQVDLGAIAMTAEGAATWAATVETHPSLRTLDLEWNRVGDAGAGALARALSSGSSMLERLGLKRNQLGDAAAVALSETLRTNQRLQVLSLEGNAIGAEGVRAIGSALSDNRALRILNLGLNPAGAEGGRGLADGLRTNMWLQRLMLGDTALGDEGAVALARSLRFNGALVHLDLRQNGIGDVGALALAEALRLNTGLRTLHLDLNSIGSVGAAELLSAVRANPYLQSLTLERNEVYPPLGAPRIAGISSVVHHELLAVLGARNQMV